MDVILVADDVIFPTNSGGRLELLGECRALASAGCSVSLVVSHRQDLGPNAALDHLSAVDRVHFSKRSNIVKASIFDPLSPFQVSSRNSLSAALIESLRSTSTIAVIASHEWTLPIARQIARQLKLPLILRSHNDEVKYMNSLAKNSSGTRRIYYELEKHRLRYRLPRFYSWIKCAAVLSTLDEDSYRRYGVPTRYIPPVLSLEKPLSMERAQGSKAPAILFIGALDMPQTASGLTWFCNEVLPKIKESVEGAELHVAGRRATPKLKEFLESCPGVVFYGEVQDTAELYSTARIFINPVFEGSGVNMKVGPPAERGIPVISTTIGARGLDALLPGMILADSPDSFASACIELINDPELWMVKSEGIADAVRQFSAPAVGQALLTMLKQVSKN